MKNLFFLFLPGLLLFSSCKDDPRVEPEKVYKDHERTVYFAAVSTDQIVITNNTGNDSLNIYHYFYNISDSAKIYRIKPLTNLYRDTVSVLKHYKDLTFTPAHAINIEMDTVRLYIAPLDTHGLAPEEYKLVDTWYPIKNTSL